MLPTSKNMYNGSKAHGWESFSRGASRRTINNFPSFIIAFTVGFLACLVAMSVVQLTLIPTKNVDYVASNAPSASVPDIIPNNHHPATAPTHAHADEDIAPVPLFPREQNNNRKKVLAVVGVQTGFTDPKNLNSRKYDYTARRHALRQTWFPSTSQALQDLETNHGIVVRFVIGKPSPTTNKNPEELESQIKVEEEKYGEFIRLPLEEDYNSLTNKTLAFFTHVVEQYDAEYILKIDDDVYFRIDRLSHAIKQWKDVDAGYVGCMKTGEILKSPKFRWWEPQWELLGGARYFAHAWGSAYALSGAAASFLTSFSRNRLRFLANEDTTVGLWMLTFNVKHLDDRRLCESSCTTSSLVTYDIPQCSGLCYAAEELVSLHNSTECHSPAVPRLGADLPLAPSMFYFDGRPDLEWEEAKVKQYAEHQKRVAEMEREKAQKMAKLEAELNAAASGGKTESIENNNNSNNDGGLENIFGKVTVAANNNDGN